METYCSSCPTPDLCRSSFVVALVSENTRTSLAEHGRDGERGATWRISGGRHVGDDTRSRVLRLGEWFGRK